MTRYAYSILMAGFLAAVVGAQGPKTNKDLSPSQRTELFKTNKSVIDSLVNSSLELGQNPHDPLRRAETYKAVLDVFDDQLHKAIQQGNSQRVKELGKHMTAVIDKGLTPQLQEANRSIGPSGTRRGDLDKLGETIQKQAAAMETQISENKASLGNSTELDELTKEMKESGDKVREAVGKK